MSELPFVPYEGPEPYIFVSYAHANKDKVYPVIKRLHEMGYRLWYDEGIQGGEKWWSVITQHLNESCYMLLFVTPDAVKSEWVADEVFEAREQKISIFPIYLQHTKQISLPIKRYHYIEKWVFASEDNFFEKLCQGLPEKTKQSEIVPINMSFPETTINIALTSLIHEASHFYSPKSNLVKGYSCVDGKICRYYGNDKTIIIPTIINDSPVAEISFIQDAEGEPVAGAFELAPIENIVLPPTLVKINSLAFMHCEDLVHVAFLDDVTYIADNAFGDINHPPNPNLTFHCPKNSYAEQYARKHNIKVKYTDQEVLT